MIEIKTTIPALRIIVQAILEAEKGQICPDTLEELNKIIEANET
jgi:hypothetical protein